MARRKHVVRALRNAADQSDSKWFTLLPEMRTRIYEIIFEDQPIEIPGKSYPAILLTCKHTYAEALQIFFNKTRFIFLTMTALKHWTSLLGPVNLSSVSKVDLLLTSTNQYRFLRKWKTGSLAVAMESELQELRAMLERRQVKFRPGDLKIRCLYWGDEKVWQFERKEDGTEEVVETFWWYYPAEENGGSEGEWRLAPILKRLGN